MGYHGRTEEQAIHLYVIGKRSHCRRKGHCKFLLSESDVKQLLDEAGITIYDLGRQAHEYHLGRYGDTGDYTMDNCRFITQRENVTEGNLGRKHTPETLEKLSRPRAPCSDSTKDKLKQVVRTSEWIDNQKKAQQARAEREKGTEVSCIACRKYCKTLRGLITHRRFCSESQ